MHLTLYSTCLLIAAGILAGFLNAIAGGGTLVTFPLLILLGMNGIIANATSTVALMLGIFGSFWGYRHQWPLILPWLRLLLPVSILGGLLGGILLTVTPTRIFDFLVPYLIFLATILFMMRNFFVRYLMNDLEENHAPARWTATFSQFFISIYGGYFGAGIGILMLSTLGMMGLHNIVTLNALKTILGGAINLVAALYFICIGLPHWPTGLILALGALPGYYLGAIFAQRISPTTVRCLIVIIGLILAGTTFFQQMRK